MEDVPSIAPDNPELEAHNHELLRAREFIYHPELSIEENLANLNLHPAWYLQQLEQVLFERHEYPDISTPDDKEDTVVIDGTHYSARGLIDFSIHRDTPTLSEIEPHLVRVRKQPEKLKAKAKKIYNRIEKEIYDKTDKDRRLRVLAVISYLTEISNQSPKTQDQQGAAPNQEKEPA